MKSRAPRMTYLLGTGLLSFLAAGMIWAQDYSHARIVRLSFAEGTVTVQRPDVAEWAQAPVNTPIQEGFKLSTAENSFAEVEFENGSTVRLGQLSLLEFTQLALAPNGSKVNRLALSQGYATFYALLEGDDNYEVTTPNGTFTPQGKAQFRVDLDEAVERVEVFKGSVGVSSFLGTWTLGKNAVLELRPGTDQPYILSEGITEDAWDQWVSDRASQESMAASRSGPTPTMYSNNVSDLLYGWNDLSMYGMWSYLPGYGYGWVPRVSADWGPYRTGRWCWYPGFGYTWISGEPWGWLPYHYGEWVYVNNFGWGWVPGNFGVWSPGLVSWYAGPGWIGWVPRGNLQGVAAGHNCGQARVCGSVMSVNAFQNGSFVTPGNAMPVNPMQGQWVQQPNISPTRTGMLPGPAMAGGAAFTSPNANAGSAAGIHVRRIDQNQPSQAGSAGTRSIAAPAPNVSRVNPTAGRNAAAPGASVVFDPRDGHFVNAPGTPSAGSVRTSDVGASRALEASEPRRPSVQGVRPVAPVGGGESGQPFTVPGRIAPAAPSGGGQPSPQTPRGTATIAPRGPSSFVERTPRETAPPMRAAPTRGVWSQRSAPSSSVGTVGVSRSEGRFEGGSARPASAGSGEGGGGARTTGTNSTGARR